MNDKFKKIGIKRAEDYVKEVNTKGLVNCMLPNCDITVGEACFDDYTSGYNQAVLDTKAKEMLDMLQYLNNKGGLGFDVHEKINLLIKQVTEIKEN